MGTRLVFVDFHVADAAQLLASLPADAVVVRVDASSDAFAQMSSVITAQQDISSIEILSHGSQGSLLLGADTVTMETLAQRAGDLLAWRDYLSPDADLLLYGCSIASGDAGAAFIDSLAKLTGADVAASIDATGGALRHGNWVLEARTGLIETESLALHDYGHVLDVYVGTVHDDTIIGSIGNDSIFGAGGNDSLVGLAGDDQLTGSSGINTLVGGSGDDTYIVGAYDIVVEASGEGNDTVRSQKPWTLGPNVENLVLTLNVNGTGNELDNYIEGADTSNTIRGEAGNDTLRGDGGADTLVGGSGDDSYQLVDPSDTIMESPDEGWDTVFSTQDATLAANVEELQLGGSLRGVGNAAANRLTGNAYKNTLDGAGGADTLIGALGDDTYFVDSADDTIEENAEEGTDIVYSTSNYTLSDSLEQLVLEGSALSGTGNDAANSISGTGTSYTLDGAGGNDTLDGSAGADVLSGSAGADVLSGSAGADVLSGGTGDDTLDGSAGADVLSGGAGDDTYLADAEDTIIEFDDEGTDTVRSGLSHTLSSQVENLLLTGIGAIRGTGNAEANRITGNGSANTLNGGIGDDTLAGGFGDDTYVVDSLADTVSELFDRGTDTVQSRVSHTLASGVERLVLIGTAASGTGNEGNNELRGSAVANTLNGASGNDTLDGAKGADTLRGGAGDDTYHADAADSIVEVPGEGIDTVLSDISWTLAENVESLRLGGSATIGTGNPDSNDILGNDAANTLIGGAGNDTLDGAAGVDQLVGGAGDDRYLVDTDDSIVESAGAGTDTVVSGASYTLPANFENLLLGGDTATRGTGNTLGNIILGNALDNTLLGGAGPDTLEGASGADALYGGTGDDTYLADFEDTITESVGAGWDSVTIAASHTLAPNVEELRLVGFASSATGNASDNKLSGNATSNTLDGGSGNDTLAGGLGNDVYLVDQAGDSILEYTGEGTDSVQSETSFTLGENVEALLLVGQSGISGTGNSAANFLFGNGAGNTLSGAEGNDTLDGGVGADVLIGGTGNDTYRVDATDTVVELAGEGIDTIECDSSYTLGSQLENLVLTGMVAHRGTGNAGANNLVGNVGADTLNGGGGSDTLAGGLGDDTYLVNSVGDTVVEAFSAGTDIVRASVSHTLAFHLEHLVLTGAGSFNGSGNAGANRLTGNAGANLLNGRAGSDTLAGGGGADAFVFDTALAKANVDTITDFAPGIDRILLDDNVFTQFDAALSTALAAGSFVAAAGAVAQDGDDRVLYDTATGRLYYDADGNGAGLALQFATVGASIHPLLTAGDFLIVD